MWVIRNPNPKVLNKTILVIQRDGFSTQTVSLSVFNVAYVALHSLNRIKILIHLQYIK